VAAAASVGWLVKDHLEQDNDFCHACCIDPAADFLHVARERSRCVRCDSEFEEGVG
jgi:hypothetical protein